MGAPVLAPIERVKGAYTALGYKAALVERTAGHNVATAGSGDLHLRYDRELLGRIADRFERDNGIYAGLVERFLDSVLGPEGFALDPETGNKALNKRIRNDWLDFGRVLPGKQGPEVRNLFDWLDIQRLGLRSIANHGDVGVIFTDEARWQFAEGAQITGGRLTTRGAKRRGNHVEQGIELDRLGAPLAYWVAPRDENGLVQQRRAVRVAAEDFLLCANRKRFSQTRGVPILATTFAMVHRISDVCDSEAIAWQSLAKFALTVTRNNSAELAYAESKEDDDGRTAGSNGDGDLADRVMELEEAIFFFAEKGETISAVKRDLPGRNFPESVRMFLRLIGLPLGIPLEVILLDYSKTNYSSARAALEQAYRMFVAWQRWLARKFHTPLYLSWLRWQIARGVYPNRASTYEHSWTAPEFPWVDHLQESKAWGSRMDRGLATHGQALRSINVDRDAFMDARVAEIEDAIQRADKINSKYPSANVDWRHLAGVEVSKAASAATADATLPSSNRDQGED